MMPRKKNHQLRTVPEAAMQLGVSERTVRREITAGNLLTVRIGPARRLVRIEDTEIERYVRSRFE